MLLDKCSHLCYNKTKENKVMDWSYVAGFFDGEGHVGYIHKKSDKPNPCLAWTNNNRMVLERIAEFLNSHGIRTAIYISKLGIGNHKTSYRLFVRDKVSAEDCIYGIIPYLLIKGPVVEEALEILDGIVGRKKYRGRD